MPKYTIETPRGNKVTIEADTPEAATRGAQTWDLQDYATKEATRLGLDPGLALKQMHQESGGNPGAVSPKGAIGPMQLMPETARGLGVDPNDPYQNITGGLTYYAKLKKQFGDDRTALAAYNAGPGNVQKYKGVPPFKETQDYVNAILGGSAPTPARGPMDMAGAAPTADKMRAFAMGKGAAKDVAQSGLSGFNKGMAGMADAALTHMVGGPLAILQQAASLASGQAPGASAPVSVNARMAERTGHTPLSTAGQWANTAGSMIPMAALGGGGLVQRAANVVLPTLGAEGSAQGVKALGGGEDVQNAARTIGGVAGGLATGIRAPTRVPQLQPQPQSLSEMDKAQNAAWKAVDASGYRFPAPHVQAAANDIRQIANDAGPELYENSTKVANRVEDLASRGELTPAQANRLRSQIGEKLLKPGSDEASVGLAIKSRIDQLIDTGAEASPLLKDARAKYTQFMKMKDVTQRLEDAGTNKAASGNGGNANAIRQALKPLVKNKSNQRMRNATPDEMAALKTVVGGTPLQNLLRAGSAFDPFHSKLGTLLQTAMGVKTLGASALTIPVGMAATVGERAIGNSNLQKALDLISTGGQAPARQGMIGYRARFPAIAAGLPGMTALLAPTAIAARTPASQRKQTSR